MITASKVLDGLNSRNDAAAVVQVAAAKPAQTSRSSAVIGYRGSMTEKADTSLDR